MPRQLTDIEQKVQALEDEIIRSELKKQARKDGSELETLRAESCFR